MPRQFAEGRAPTQAEIADAAPEHRVYVQLLYSRVLLSPGSDQALGLAEDGASAAGFQSSATAMVGRPAGSAAITAPSAICSIGCRARHRRTDRRHPRLLPGAQRRRHHRGDRSGRLQSPIEAYPAVLQVWRDGALTMRVVYSLCAPRRDHELKDFKALTSRRWALATMAAFNGIGENVTWGMYNNDTPVRRAKGAALSGAPLGGAAAA